MLLLWVASFCSSKLFMLYAGQRKTQELSTVSFFQPLIPQLVCLPFLLLTSSYMYCICFICLICIALRNFGCLYQKEWEKVFHHLSGSRSTHGLSINHGYVMCFYQLSISHNLHIVVSEQT